MRFSAARRWLIPGLAVTVTVAVLGLGVSSLKAEHSDTVPSEQVIIGNTVSFKANLHAALQVHGLDSASTEVTISRFSSGIDGPAFELFRSSGTALGEDVANVKGQQLGTLNYIGTFGTGHSMGATLRVFTDNDWTSADTLRASMRVFTIKSHVADMGEAARWDSEQRTFLKSLQVGGEFGVDRVGLQSGDISATGDISAVGRGNFGGVYIGTHQKYVTVGATLTPDLEVLGTTDGSAHALIGRWSADAKPPYLTLFKSRNGLIGGLGPPLSVGDEVGVVQGMSYDGTPLARMKFVLDAGSTGGRLSLHTSTANGDMVEGLRIDSNQVVSVSRLQVGGTGIHTGTGAPVDANGADGDFYFRSDGGAMTTVYQRRAGVWVGII